MDVVCIAILLAEKSRGANCEGSSRHNGSASGNGGGFFH